MTQIESAKKGVITPIVNKVARLENISAQHIRKGLQNGTVVVPANKLRRIKKPCAIGKGLRTKINANIGTSPLSHSIKEELKKLKICVEYKADTVMDLSTGGDIRKIRRAILENSPVPVGTVPVYEAFVDAAKRGLSFDKLSDEHMFDVIESQARDGVDFFTIHAGVTRNVLQHLKRHPRVMGIVSRGGALIARWIHKNNKENPLFEQFDRVISIAKEYDITLSLGDGLRPGSVCDATDRPQIEELRALGELARRARGKGVQVMIEGPGHVPINQVQINMELEKKICDNAPFYVLGPLVTDVAAGYDHISSAIGAAMAAYHGADFLCYVTPSEHLGIPTEDDVRDGLIAYRIAAHSADIAKGVKNAIDWDKKVSVLRRRRLWNKHINSLIDPKRAMSIYKRCAVPNSDVCSMCGEYCPLKISQG